MQDTYDPPPIPEGVSPDTAYMAQVYASGTRAILREGARRHDEVMKVAKGADREGLGGWLGHMAAKLPAPVQTSLALAMGMLLYQFVGSLLTQTTGHSLPPLDLSTPAIPAATASPE